MSIPNVRSRIGIAALRKLYPVNASTIYRRYQSGEFPAPHYIENRRYWYLDEVEAWLTDQMARAHEPRRFSKRRLARTEPSK